ncbi:acetyl-CoA hydrolase/transferase family protein [Phaeocystidibacter luteus]|uniref:Acetyl-CoA hydrolase/transferase family protein n=1 Tax=Phaeocystidibacter luteus TaxID=911197 RepID=A0A6N6RLE7_9FLAO|nr:acetyl-CoA hydrolase/transferase C-terminal domain-containing protein [Phaeocystidibacter luteus]KAB2814396.1 acetyl-CoA hydrolase/transferase family protein [Phaeocystidibacter luteus]
MALFVSATDALQHVKPEQNIYIHTAAAAPQALVHALAERGSQLYGNKIYHLHTDGDAPYAEPEFAGIFDVYCLFIGANVRKAIWNGRAQFVPSFLSEVPGMFRKGIIPLDVALIQVSPPDAHGFCSLGVSIDATNAAWRMSKLVIAQINPKMPRSHGDGLIHLNDIDYAVEHEQDLPEHAPGVISAEEALIGENIAGMIENGSTLQMGIGSIPNAVLAKLGNHKDLGIHTEMFSDGIIPLVESGVINNSQKRIHPGKIVSGFAFGTRKLYDFIHDNPMVNMLDIAYVNDVSVIRKNPRVVAINSAIEVDVTGQVCADSIGTRFYSGVGGQMDFIRGASLSEGGKPIIALGSQTNKGLSKIVPQLKPGAGVVTTRAHVHYVVTEYGVADLYGKSIRERVDAMIKIAHPEHREQLEREAYELYHA